MSFGTLGQWFASGALQTAAPYLACAALAAAVGCLAYAAALKRRFARLALGRNGSVEESIAVILRELKDLKKFRAEVETYLKVAEERIAGSARGIGVVRFNPFKGEGSGGNQSFVVALLDEAGSGVTLSALSSRERTSIYAKPLERGASPFTLTDEEQEAVALAKERALAYKQKHT